MSLSEKRSLQQSRKRTREKKERKKERKKGEYLYLGRPLIVARTSKAHFTEQIHEEVGRKISGGRDKLGF